MSTGVSAVPTLLAAVVDPVITGLADTVHGTSCEVLPKALLTEIEAVPDVAAADAGRCGVPITSTTPAESVAASPAGSPVTVIDVGLPVVVMWTSAGVPAMTARAL